MFDKTYSLFEGLLKNKPYWPAVQPFLLLGFCFVTVEAMAFQIWQSQFAHLPSIQLFLTSYLARRIVLVFLGLCALMLLFRLKKWRRVEGEKRPASETWRANKGTIMFRCAVFMVIFLAVGAGFVATSPRSVSHIRIMFLVEEPDSAPEGYDRYALAYLLYELNQLQDTWYFEIDFERNHPDDLNDVPEVEHSPILSWTQAYSREFADGSPVICITHRHLGRGAKFATHMDNISVITTADDEYKPVDTYEYLMHFVIVQSILIHLDTYGGGRPETYFKESGTSHGGVFEFTQKALAIKPRLLAARFSPREEELLVNRFGPKYANDCVELIKLDWLRSERVQRNLKVFLTPKE